MSSEISNRVQDVKEPAEFMSQLHDRTNPEFSPNQSMEIQSPNERLTARDQGTIVAMQTDETLIRNGIPADATANRHQGVGTH